MSGAAFLHTSTFLVGERTCTVSVPPLKAGEPAGSLIVEWSPPTAWADLTDEERRQYVAGRDEVLEAVGKRLGCRIRSDGPPLGLLDGDPAYLTDWPGLRGGVPEDPLDTAGGVLRNIDVLHHVAPLVVHIVETRRPPETEALFSMARAVEQATLKICTEAANNSVAATFANLRLAKAFIAYHRVIVDGSATSATGTLEDDSLDELYARVLNFAEIIIAADARQKAADHA